MRCTAHGNQLTQTDHRPQTTDHRPQTTDHRRTHFKSFLLPDDTLINIMRNVYFKKLLSTSSVKGQDFIAEYYGISNWAQLKEKGAKDGLIQNQADSYFYLLKADKAKSNKDNVWISFYEGLHCHAALLISLSLLFLIQKRMSSNIGH